MRRIAEQKGMHLSKQGLSTGAVRLEQLIFLNFELLYLLSFTSLRTTLFLNPGHTVSPVQHLSVF
jgi:hypothetical protein